MTFFSDRLVTALPPASRRPSLFDLLDLARQRRALARLDDDRLRDLGLTRHEALREARRPVWDHPGHWTEN